MAEYVESVISAVNFPATTVYGDATSISLDAGTWDVHALATVSTNGATVVLWSIGISTTSGNSTAGLAVGDNWTNGDLPPVPSANAVSAIPAWRLVLGATTTVYLKYAATFTVATPQIYGRISAQLVPATPGTKVSALADIVTLAAG